MKLCVACVATMFNSTFGLLLLWEKFFPTNEICCGGEKGLGSYLAFTSGVVPCLLAVLEKKQGHHKEGWRARYHMRTHIQKCTRGSL